MIVEGSLMSIVLSIIAFPLQLYRHLIWSGLDFIAFDVLGLGPYLPITL